jgi:hypothetical protein
LISALARAVRRVLDLATLPLDLDTLLSGA